uniref:Uncharacterized protein n=1 Tax=Rhizophora mucronata TaxID=61149 RepID=A0A2P2NUH6_RHIMU
MTFIFHIIFYSWIAK